MKKTLVLTILTLLTLKVFCQIIPDSYGTILIKHTYYQVGLDPQTKVASWVMHTMTPKMAQDLATDVPREDAFRPDPLVEKELQGSDADYRSSGYDRGHLCPAEDMDFNASAMLECFYYTNMAPQNPTLNRGLWRKIETISRGWAQSDTVHIITGTFSEPNGKFIGKGISVPTYFYKIVVDKNYTKSIAFITPNIKPIYDVKNYITTIDKIEELTGVDFFEKLNDDLENKLEEKSDLNHFKL